MDETELHERLAEILAGEDRTCPDWHRVEGLCLALGKDLMDAPNVECADSVWHFLDDPGIRQRDTVYAEGQRDQVRWYLQTGGMTERAPSKKVPLWGCLLVLGLVAAIAAWLLV